MPVSIPTLSTDAVRLSCTAVDKADAIRQTGEVLLAVGAVEPAYLAAMHEREASITTYVGEGVAIPHGTNEARSLVKRTALAFLQFPGGVDWGDGQRVVLCIGIAASGDEHVSVLAALARILTNPAQAAQLRDATDINDVVRLLQPVGKEN